MPKPQPQAQKWSFLIDRGGTFTDILAISPDGTINPMKLLSENPAAYPDAGIEAIRQCLGLTPDAPIPKNKINTIRMGTTVATNALLEHKGEPTLLVTSQGLSDCLEIGTQARPDIFALNIQKPTMLYAKPIALRERIAADGTIITPLDQDHTATLLENHHKAGLRAVAILLMHSYKFPAHEQQVAKLAKDIGYTHISMSHQISPLIKYIPRGDTTTINAYLTPCLKRYTNQLEALLQPKENNIKLYFMTSSGGLTKPNHFIGKDAILSGPAGGLVGAASTASKEGAEDIICFDMGGTSTDVAEKSGPFHLKFETDIAGHRLQTPMLDIHTVAAGGGSILAFAHNRLTVGPESAGAHPGPKCYRNGGPLTVTDANLMTGRLDPDFFPPIFGPNQDQPLDKTAVEIAFKQLAEKIDPALTPEQCAEGFLNIANENMTAAIKKISLERGIDIKNHTLVSYGGASGQHCAAIAENLGLNKIFIHAQSGLLSAYGMGCAKETARRRQMLNRPLETLTADALSTIANKLSTDAKNDLETTNPTIRVTCYLAYQASETKLPIPLAAPKHMQSAFEKAHQQQFGFIQQNTPLHLEHIEVECSENETLIPEPPTKSPQTTPPPPTKEARLFTNNQWQATALYAPSASAALNGHTIKGPALLIEQNQTLYVPKGWQAHKTTAGHTHLQKTNTDQTKQQLNTRKPDPIQRELFNCLFMSIAEQMGEALRGAAQSVNIKERLDFSCALFNQDGALIANAPHMPVHLGSMDQAVTAIIKANPKGLQSGDAFMINDPYSGGTHLPDITVITPVFHQDQLIAYVAARGHHADIGGIAPGSMSPKATHIDQEGILFKNVQIVKNGVFQEETVLKLLETSPNPARNPAQNIADLKAQLAACAKGAAELEAAAAHYGPEGLMAYMRFTLDQSEQAVKNLIKQIATTKLDGLFAGHYHVETDQGAHISVTITPNTADETLTIDFTGTSAQTNDNFNAPAPVTRAAVLYVIRTLLVGQIPMNAGCLRPIELIIPERSLLSPEHPAAVVAGNVETSQMLTNCLYGAFGCLGLAQGTMNNLTFGNEKYQYYETICSGAPAGPGFNGTHAVHTHMTNSRLTDPEILETRYPVRLEEFSIRRGSGGKGKWHAGDGVLRTLKFNEPMTLALLTGQRQRSIPGMKGGNPGEKGQNLLISHSGTIKKLPSSCEQHVQPGEAITIITPTGGGYGPPKSGGQ